MGWTDLFNGLSVKVDTFMDVSSIQSSVIIELCKGNPESALSCKGNVEVVNCKRLPADINNIFQWDCLTGKNYPYRLGLKTGKSVLYSANSYYLAEDRTGDRYALHLESGLLDAIKIPFELSLQIGMQEMLENVFHPSIVQKIREQDRNKKSSWLFIDNPETRLLLTSCQFQDCSKGKREEVACKFATLGIKAISYSCPLPSFARYVGFTLYGRDKVRKTEIIRFKDRKSGGGGGMNYISLKKDSLEVQYDFYRSF